MAPITTGSYTIMNVRHRHNACLLDGTPRSPLVPRRIGASVGEAWIVTALSNGLYTIQNAEYKMFASVSPNAQDGAEVTSQGQSQEWNIVETSTTGQYVIYPVVTGSNGIWNLANTRSNVGVPGLRTSSFLTPLLYIVLAPEDEASLNACTHWIFTSEESDLTPVAASPGLESLAGLVISTSAPPSNVPPSSASSSSAPLTNTPPSNTSDALEGLVDWREASIRLPPGEYTIRKVGNKSQWTMYTGCMPPSIAAPLWFFTKSNISFGRKFSVAYDQTTGGAYITSAWPPNAPVRYFQDGRTFQPQETLCRMYGIPTNTNVFVITTDITTNPPRVLQDIQSRPLDHTTPVSNIYKLGDPSQQWEFIRNK